MKDFFSLWNRPYDLYRKRRHRKMFSLFFAGFAWFLLFVFGVFEFDYFDPVKRLYITGLYALACWLASMFNFFVIQDTLIKKCTLGSAFLVSLLIMFTIGLFNYLLTALVFQWEPFSLNVFIKNQLNALAIGVLMGPFIILAHYSYLMKKHSGSAHMPAPLKPEKMLFLESDYKYMNLELEVKDLYSLSRPTTI